jgi:HD-GYP domain-containing protein (c-di-GMP phosphodiesterase class II)
MYKLDIENVFPGMIVQQDIYVEKNARLPLLAEGTKITPSFLAQLKNRGVKFLYAEKPFENMNRQLQKNPISKAFIPMQKSKSIIPTKTKSEVLNTIKDFQISLSGLDVDDVCKVVNSLDDILGRILTAFPKNMSEPINVHHLRSDDATSYVYGHSLSVAVISMAMGQYLSLPAEDVLQLGKCASLHDIGMFFLTDDIVQKSSNLQKDEREYMKRHTQLGYRCLVKMDVVDEQICNSILHHHERVDGSGYPLGLKGDEIPLWSRIIAVADIYDAMTSVRFHRPALAPAETCEYIMSNANRTLEYDIVAALLRRIEFYPVGICVKLSGGDYAVVMENTRSKLRPTVRVINTDNIVDLNDRKFLDITILRAISYQDIIERK